MITDSVNREFRTPKGMICCHVHIYADNLKNCRLLYADAQEVIKRLCERWTLEGKVTAGPFGETRVGK